MTIDTKGGIDEVRKALDLLYVAISDLENLDAPSDANGGDKPELVSINLTQAEARKLFEQRIAAAKDRLRELGFTGPVTRVNS